MSYARINRNSLRQFMKSRTRLFFRSRWLAPVHDKNGNDTGIISMRTATYRKPVSE